MTGVRCLALVLFRFEGARLLRRRVVFFEMGFSPRRSRP